jgi:hypothetical protein
VATTKPPTTTIPTTTIPTTTISTTKTPTTTILTTTTPAPCSATCPNFQAKNVSIIFLSFMLSMDPGSSVHLQLKIAYL